MPFLSKQCVHKNVKFKTQSYPLITIALFSFPVEVARTRMRQEGDMYRKFWGTLAKVAADEGWQGLYKGLFTQLVRAIPNTAIMMATYELTVYALSPHHHKHSETYDDLTE